ncbi:hypothetical protein [Sphingobacterium anhuiense]|uniref:hypothetical protein n=1 Tax=Sphingobacterium anhuiense TaxID=493780 RepID=UPI003C2C0A89
MEIDRDNCSSFHQQGKGYTDGDVPAVVHGNIRMCYNNKIVPKAKVLFISGKDTIETLITDEKGKFSKELSVDGFWGSIIIDRFGSSLTIEDVRIDGNFKDYYLDIKLPRQPVYWNESGPKKDQKKLRKEVEKANKTRK